MKVSKIEALPEVRQATKVLSGLEDSGLIEPAIASGWTRAMLTDTTPTDIDVAYVGPVHYNEAQQHLKDVLSELGYDPKPWDIKGIWNAQMSHGVERTVDNFLLYYVCSIDSVYLASDGKLHDPTGLGLEDANAKILRINEYDRQNGRQPTAYEEVYVCLQGCRRITQHKWEPTPESKQRITEGVKIWDKLSEDEKAHFIQKLGDKFKIDEREAAQGLYNHFGWGFIFDFL